jgi:hypothetical protein
MEMKEYRFNKIVNILNLLPISKDITNIIRNRYNLSSNIDIIRNRKECIIELYSYNNFVNEGYLDRRLLIRTIKKITKRNKLEKR